MNNRLSLTAISFLANFIIAGFASQFGMLTEPIAKAFHAEIEYVASIFSLLNGGALVGTVLAFFLIDIIGAKKITLTSYIIVSFCTFVLYFSSSLLVINICMMLIGVCGGIGLCIAGTIIVSIWQNKVRSTMFVIQDATFNIAGVIFPLITTTALFHNFHWATSYLVVGMVSLFAVVIIALTNFEFINKSKQAVNIKAEGSEWNFGIFSAGISLFIAMLALYTFLTWSPIFISTKFSIPFENAGNIITQYWSAALIGAIISTVIVSKMKIQNFFIMIIGLAMIMTILIATTTRLSNIGYFTYGYGFVCSALYNSAIAYGVTFVKQASSKNVSFILISGSTGAMVGPVLSSLFHKEYNNQVIMNIIPMLYSFILLLLIISLIIQKKSKKYYPQLTQ